MDTVTPEKRSWIMSRVRSKDTSIELKLRHALWHAGIRYRKNYTKLPGTPDIAVTKYKIAIFADSSFWHGRDYETKKKPGTNTAYWDKKIRRNIDRDYEVDQMLRGKGWTVLRFWDVDIQKNLDSCVAAVKEAIFDVSVSNDSFPEYEKEDFSSPVT